MFKRSALELKSVKNLCVISFLLAIKIVIQLTCTIRIANYLYIGFSFLIFIVTGSMFGPVVSFLFGFMADILGFCVCSSKGGGDFFIGFTISSIVSAVIYSLFLYKFKLGVIRVVFAQIIHDLVVCFWLNTLWLSITRFNGDLQKAFFNRILKECLVLPINCVMALVVASAFKKVVERLKLS